MSIFLFLFFLFCVGNVTFVTSFLSSPFLSFHLLLVSPFIISFLFLFVLFCFSLVLLFIYVLRKVGNAVDLGIVFSEIQFYIQ